ncbi:MAG: DUF421 domain-containing protein [Acetobacteraceae bacterium]|nr:DUF421 domain-containing protein [Acetobacteraceae bacterium]
MDLLGPHASLPLLGFVLRTVVVFVVLVAMVRVMGKREVGQLSPFDFAVGVTIGSIAATPLGRGEASVADALISAGTFTFLQVALAVLSLRSRRLARFFSGGPSVLISGGRVVEKNLRRTRVNLEELYSLVRLQGARDISEVEVAVLEPDGRLSLIKRSQLEPVTPRDLGVSTAYEGLPTVLIDDGEVKEHELKKLGLSRAWLLGELARRGISDPGRVLLASLDTGGRLMIQGRRGAPGGGPGGGNPSPQTGSGP